MSTNPVHGGGSSNLPVCVLCATLLAILYLVCGKSRVAEGELARRAKEIAALNSALADAQVALADERDARHREQKEFGERIQILKVAVARVPENLEGAQVTAESRADGVVRWVDHSALTVWINVGEADGLRKRTRFRVGSAEHFESIEVTRIVGPHMAEATILPTDPEAFISVGDAIYSRDWNPGRPDLYSFVGVIDLDGDGKGDREMLHEAIEASGARIDNEVDDFGHRVGNGITSRTKFLIVGRLPSNELPPEATAEEIRIRTRTLGHCEALLAEAKQHGVRIVPLSDFLGFRSGATSRRNRERFDRNLDQRPYRLNSRDDRPGPRAAAEYVGGVYSGDRRVKAKTSTGRTSRLMKGGS